MDEPSKWLLAAVFNPANLDGLSANDMVFGASYANVLAARTQIALKLIAENRHSEAEALLLGILEQRQKFLGADHRHTLQTAGYLGHALYAQKKYGYAENIYREGLELFKGGLDDAGLAAFSSNLGMVLLLQHKFNEAEALCRQTKDHYEAKLGQGHTAIHTISQIQGMLTQIRESGQGNVVSELEKQLQVPLKMRRQPQAKKFVMRSYKRALQTRSIMQEDMRLIEGPRYRAALFATSRNTIELSYPGLDDLLRIDELDLILPICSVCASINPWWRETAGFFNGKLVGATPEYIRTVKAADIARSVEENGCFHCRLLSYGLREYSQHYYSSENGWKEKEVKIRIKGAPKEATLCVGSRKTEMVQIFALMGDEIPCAAIGTANYVARDPLTAVGGVKQLLELCIQSHAECGGAQPVELPTRVIEIGTTNEDLRIIETNGAKGTYMTLSYCWGETGDAARTTPGNINQRLQKLPFSDLGKTHRDAVDITRKLGIKYLWIDAVCIIQGDRVDWEKESVKMADVYKNSMLTIAAAHSTHAQGGILVDRPELTSEGRMLVFQTEDGPQRIAFRLPILNHHVWSNCVTEQYFPINPIDMEYLPLENRAWCLQERVLSRRIVHFAEQELFWECQEAKRCECGEIGGHNFAGHGPATLRDDFLNAATSTSQNERNHFWMGIVAECTRRGIKYCSDRLPALSGIAQTLQRAGHGEYLAGLWRNSLLEQLLWTVDSIETARRVQSPSAPSWSWASIEPSSISFPVDTYATGKKCAEIEAVSCTSSSAGPFSNAIKGTLRLNAMVVWAKLRWFQQLDGQDTLPFPGARRQRAFEISIPGESAMVCRLEPDFRLLDPEFDEWVKRNPILQLPRGTGLEPSSSAQSGGPSPQLQPTAETDVGIVAIIELEPPSNASSRRLCGLAVRKVNICSPNTSFERVGLVSIEDGSSVERFFEIQKKDTVELI